MSFFTRRNPPIRCEPLHIVVRCFSLRKTTKTIECVRIRIAILHRRLHTQKPHFSIHET